MANEPWVQLWNGDAFLGDNLEQSLFSINSLAWSLAGIGRYNSHTKGRNVYSVAEHCCLISDYLLRTEGLAESLGGLLHDAHEAITGDMTSPMQKAMEERCPGFRFAFAELQTQIDSYLMASLGLQEIDLESASVRLADLRIIGDEQIQAMEPSPLPQGNGWPIVQPLGVTLQFWNREQAAREWGERLGLRRLEYLRKREAGLV